jgi:CRP-like cAMP-binding protein
MSSKSKSGFVNDLIRRSNVETETLERILREHPFFKEVKEHHLRAIIESATVVRFEPGDVIFREGDLAQSFYLIRTGKVVLQHACYRVEPVTVLTVGQGEIAGWSWLFPPYRWRLTAIALEITRAIAVDGAKLRARCDEDHDLGYGLMKQFAKIIDIRFDAVSERLVEVEV